MKDKYYTPNISEFHIGFEYEIQPDYEGEWIKMNKLDNGFYANFNVFNTEPTAIMPICYRVKYLDKKDIESLEWKITEDREYDIEAQLIINDYSFYDLSYDFGDNELFIEEFYQASLVAKPIGKYNSVVRFKGVIKNVSEFKTILKQIGITK